MMVKLLVTLLGLTLIAIHVNASVPNYLRPADQNRFTKALTAGLSSNDPTSIAYALQGLNLLKEPIPNDKKTVICNALSSSLAKAASSEVAYLASLVVHHLPACKHIFKESDVQILNDILTDDSPIPDVYYAVLGLSNLGKPIPNVLKVVQNLQNKLKTEDSITNLGYTFNIAARLGANGKFALDRVEEALVQADEVDNKLLQFEGGLSVTSLVLVGIQKLYVAQNVPSTITKEQAEKFASYLVSRRSVQTVKGIACLLEAVKSFTDNPKLSPASISLASSGQSTISVRICDLLGNALGLSADSVIAQSATRLGDDVVVLAKQKLVATSDPIIFNLELPRERMAAGLYKVVISAGSYTASLTVTALANGAIKSLEIGIADSDQISAAKLQKLIYPAKVSLEADSQQALVVKFSFIDSATKKTLKIQQTFLRLSCLKSKREIVFVAEYDANSGYYTVNLDVGAKAAQLGGQSGSFAMTLLLGDTIVSNPLIWDLGELNIKLASTTELKDIPYPVRGPKPEIQHLFREPERRPPQTVSMFFTGLVGAPILLLFILWFKLGINVSNFTFSLGSIGFFIGLAAIYLLYATFWLQLNMFQTSRWLILFGTITFLSGHRLLRSIAEKRKH